LILSGTNLYGTTYEGGNNGGGTVFAVSTDGTVFTNFYNFSGSDGSSPQADLVLSSNILYGSTFGGGTHGYGTLFSIHTDGTGFTNFYNFSGNDGEGPNGGMVLSGNRLYGTTYAGGTSLDGSVFAINTDATGFTNLFSFANFNGYFPMGTLILSGNTLYGTTLMGGTKGYGEVFAIDTDGSGFTNLFSFTNGIDGVNPEAGLVLSGHTLYGTADGGGAKTLAMFSPSIPAAPVLRPFIVLRMALMAPLRRPASYCPAILFMARPVAAARMAMEPSTVWACRYRQQ